MAIMKWQDWLEKWGMTSLKIKVPFLQMNWEPQDADKAAAWDLYVELLTRITTQNLSANEGDEASALSSIHKIFDLTRDVMKKNGRACFEFTKIAIVVLNQVIRPFTAKWHKISVNNGFSDEITRNEFRQELEDIQKVLRIYTQMLSEMAAVENLTELEDI